MNKEIQKLHTTLKEIENLDLPNMKKDPKYFWEHELGWLDNWYEIQLIEGEMMDGKELLELYHSVFIRVYAPKWEDYDKDTKEMWNKLADKIMERIKENYT